MRSLDVEVSVIEVMLDVGAPNPGRMTTSPEHIRK